MLWYGSHIDGGVAYLTFVPALLRKGIAGVVVFAGSLVALWIIPGLCLAKLFSLKCRITKTNLEFLSRNSLIWSMPLREILAIERTRAFLVLSHRKSFESSPIKMSLLNKLLRNTIVKFDTKEIRVSLGHHGVRIAAEVEQVLNTLIRDMHCGARKENTYKDILEY